MTETRLGDFCPICGYRLNAIERVREERIPATVPEYFTRCQEAPYRTVNSYEIVVCRSRHTFKRSPDRRTLRGLGK